MNTPRKNEENLKELIDSAKEMLLDREKGEAKLIYCVCRLSEEERAGIIFAYDLLFGEEE